MNQSSRDSDEDQDSLFGSLPPSPARGRSPSQETLVTAGETGPIIAVGRKNVGTIALPGSHMSCAELPANLLASSLSLPHPTSNHLPSVAPSNLAKTPPLCHTPAVTTRSSTYIVSSRASSAASTVSSASAPARRRRMSKSKSATPIPPPITLPGPNEPTPPNFLRSQSSLFGLAGLVGCVKPAQLYTHDRQPTPVRQSCSHSPIRGSTPTHPIVIDDDQETSHGGRHPISQPQIPQCLDQLNPEIFRSNVANSLTKEKNLFPVLESLIKLLGGEPHFPSVNPPSQRFARPYGHGIFNAQPSPSVPSISTPGSLTASVPPPKRRKLKHVPAGATDWDVPFPFAAGEGPEEYRDTWVRDRAKQLVTQLLELVQGAAKRAAIKTAKNGGKVSEGRTSTRSCQSSRSASVETQIRQIKSAQTNVRESPFCPGPSGESAVNGTPVDSLGHYLGLLETPSMISSPASGSRVDSDGSLGEGTTVIPSDYSAFEEWLSQLQQFLPPGTSVSTPEPDYGTRLSIPLDSSTSRTTPDIVTQTQPATRDEAIDPALLAISQQSEQFQSPISTLMPGDMSQMPDISLIPPALAHSPRTSLSSPTEPLTPLSEAFADPPTSTTAHQNLVHDPSTHRPVEKDHPSRPENPFQLTVLSSSLTKPNELPRITAAQKGNAQGDGSIASATPSTSTPHFTSVPKGALDKQAVLRRAQERRRQLVAEIERAKVEIWEATIENAVLVHLTRDGSL